MGRCDRCCGRDCNDVFSYNTVRIMIIPDFRVMVILVVLMGLILFYYIVFVSSQQSQAIMIDQRYNLQTSEYGSIEFDMQIIDKQKATPEFINAFSQANMKESGYSAFVPLKYESLTARSISLVQIYEPCASTRKCTQNKDCVQLTKPKIYTGLCSAKSSTCQMNYWCPDIDTLPSKNFNHYQPFDNIRISVTQISDYSNGQNYSFTLQQAIQKASIGVPLSQISNLVFKIQILNYSNGLGGRSTQVKFFPVQVNNLKVPLKAEEADYYNINGVDYRYLTVQNGIRIFFESRKINKQLSLSLLTCLIASIIALLTVSTAITDFIMLRCFPKKRREAYKKAKIEKSDDFSDLQDRLYLVENS